MGMTLGYTLLNKPLSKIIAPVQIQQLAALMPVPSAAIGILDMPQNAEHQAKRKELSMKKKTPFQPSVTIPDPSNEFELLDQELLSIINDTASSNKELIYPI